MYSEKLPTDRTAPYVESVTISSAEKYRGEVKPLLHRYQRAENPKLLWGSSQTHYYALNLSVNYRVFGTLFGVKLASPMFKGGCSK